MPTPDSTSRFQTTPALFTALGDGTVVETFGLWKRPSFLRARPAQQDTGTFIVQPSQQGRPELVAEAIYGSAYLDWVIIAFNNAVDVLNWPDAGAVITYPLPHIVFAEVS